MSNAFVVNNLVELRALQRVFREAKFCTEPDDDEISASPIVAKLFEQLMTALIAQEVERDGEIAKERWTRWLAIDESRDEWDAAKRRARKEPSWYTFSVNERAEYVRLLLTPFTLSPEYVDKFVLAVNKVENFSN